MYLVGSTPATVQMEPSEPYGGEYRYFVMPNEFEARHDRQAERAGAIPANLP